MYDFIINVFIAGSSRDSDGWENLLFLIVLAVFWGISGLIKSKANESQRQKQQEYDRRQAQQARNASAKQKSELKKSDQILEKALRYKEAVTRRQNQRFEASRSGIKTPPKKIESPARKVVPQAKKPSLPVMPEQKPIVYNDELTKIGPKIQDLPEFIPQTTNVLKSKKSGLPQFVSQENLSFESLFSYGDSDELEKAILYSEILGKPLSIRSSSRFFV